MTRRAAAWLAAMLAMAACVPGGPAPLRSPSQSLAPDQTLNVRLTDPVGTLDPARAAGRSDLGVVRQLAEPLLKPSPGLRAFEPATAQSWELSSDGLVLTFKLRPNARYGDGIPVRAQDFVFSWRRLIDPRTAAPLEDTFAAAVAGGEEAATLDPGLDGARIGTALDRLGLKAPDDSTFQVTLARPQAWAPWLATLVQGAPLRSELVERLGPGWASRPEGLAGNGPFRVTAMEGRERIRLAANASYWAGKPTLRALTFQFVAEDPVAERMFRAGDLDIAAIEAGDPGSDLVQTAELSQLWLTFNTERAPFDNPQVRRAFASAVDRMAVARGGLGGRGQPSTTLVPQGMHGYRPDLGRPQEFNANQARTQLDAAGPNRELLAGLRLLTRDRPVDRAVAESVAAQLRQNLGVGISVEAADPATVRTRLRSGDFQLAAPLGWLADYPDQHQFYDLFRSTDGGDLSRWRNQRYDLLVRQADAEAESARRDPLYTQALQILEQEAPVAFLVQQVNWFLVRTTIRSRISTPLDEWPGSLFTSRIYVDARVS